MSFKLFRKEIGQQAVLPGELLMESTDDLVTITAPGYLSASDGVLPTDVITAVYGNPMVNKQTFNPLFIDGIITLQVIGGGGSINGAINLGAGDGLLGVSGDNITGKSLVAGANITLTPTGNDVTIAASGAGGGTITDGENIGTGEGHVFAAASGSLLQFKTLKEGSNVTITENSNEITIATIPAPTGITGAANLPGGEGVFANTVGSILQFKSIAAGAGIDISANSNNVIITNVGGGGGSFQYADTWWVAKNGNDANDGKSINSPKLTIAGAITAFTNTINIINIVDSGTYTGSYSLATGSALYIDAPGATLRCTAGPMFSGSNVDLYVNAALISASFQDLFNLSSSSVFFNIGTSCFGNVTNNNTATQMFINVGAQLGGDVVISQNGSTFINCDSLTGNYTDTSPASSPTMGLFANSVSGNISSTNNRIYGQAITVSGSVSGIFQGNFDQNLINQGTGYFGGAITLNLQPIINEIYSPTFSGAGPWTFNPTSTFSNKLFIIQDINGTINLPLASSVPNGYRFYLTQSGNGGATVNAQGSDDIDGQNNVTFRTSCFTGRGKMEIVKGNNNLGGGYTWNFIGLFNSSLYSGPNFFVSQVNGNDATADGSLELQFKTINGALSYIIANFGVSPTNPVNIFITDDSIYNEKLDFTGTTNIQLIGRTAQIVYASSGPGDDGFTSNSPQQFVSVAELSTTGGGKTVNYTGAGALILNVDVVTGGNTENNGPGFIFAQCYSFQGTTVNSGGGQFRYTTILRSGTDGAGVIGNASDGASQDWTVLRNLRANDNFFVKSTPVAFNVASLTITAAFLQDRIIVNNDAGPSTWTLDTATNLTAAYPGIQDNDTFSVFVSNTTGATVTFASSMGTSVTGTPTSATNFTFWMRYVGGLWELYY